MRVVLLARTVDEATDYARIATIPTKDRVTVGSSRALEGLRLSDEDLIVQFPGFTLRRDANEIIDTLLRTIQKSKVKPLWRRIGPS